jgi:hypothetical protein
MKAVRISGMLGLFVFTVIFALYLGRASSAVADKSRPGSLPPSSDMQAWLTYTDERFNFSVQYPSDWYITVHPADAVAGGVQISNYHPSVLQPKQPAPADYFSIIIMVVGGDPVKPGQSLIEWRHARGDYVGFVEPRVKEEKLVFINGLEGLEETVEYIPGSETTTIYFKYSDDKYGESVLWISAGPVEQQVMEDTFRQILSTFQMKK